MHRAAKTAQGAGSSALPLEGSFLPSCVDATAGAPGCLEHIYPRFTSSDAAQHRGLSGDGANMAGLCVEVCRALRPHRGQKRIARPGRCDAFGDMCLTLGVALAPEFKNSRNLPLVHANQKVRWNCGGCVERDDLLARCVLGGCVCRPPYWLPNKRLRRSMARVRASGCLVRTAWESCCTRTLCVPPCMARRCVRPVRWGVRSAR